MPRDKISKNYIIPPLDFHLARKFDNILKTYEDDAEALQKQFKNEMEALSEACKAEASHAWFLLAQTVGIDASATWGDPEYHLDRTYIDEGFAAIQYTKIEPHPLMGMFGGSAPGMEDEDPTKVKVPPKDKLN